jgi:hypothetical protein
VIKLITIIAGIVLWILRKIGIPVPVPGGAKAVDIKGKLFSPCFLRDADNDVVGCWEYLSREPKHQAAYRAWLKSHAVKGETPALAICLSPSDVAGGIWRRFPDEFDEARLAAAIEALKALCAAGIAVLATLYVDDPSGPERWWEIREHQSGWTRLHERIGKYVSAYLLSIETNERTWHHDRGRIEAAIDTMRAAMPGAQAYGTHLQFLGGTYRWDAAVWTPRNADLVLVEAPWDPHQGDAKGTGGIRDMMDRMGAAGLVGQYGRLIMQEYNLNAGGRIEAEQRAYLRGCGLKGVG